MKNFRLLIWSSIVVAITCVIATTIIVEKLNDYRGHKEEVSTILNIENRLIKNHDELNPFSDAGEKKVKQANLIEKDANRIYREATFYGLGLISLVVFYLVLNFYFYLNSLLKYRSIGISFVIASLCFIYLGLQTPFLEIEALNTDLTFSIDLAIFKHNLIFEGDMYYLYQNKSIFQVIKLLFTGGNIVVGITLILFSIIFPLFKLLTSLFVLIYPDARRSELLVSIVNKLGKWSMADVFVAAVFLALFAYTNMNVGVNTNATTLMGLYYFLVFVVLSIFSGYFLKQAVSFKQ